MKKIQDVIRKITVPLEKMDLAQRKMVLIKGAGVGAALILCLWLLFSGGQDTKKILSGSDGELGDEKIKEIGMFVGDVDSKTYIAKIEKQYHEMEENVKELSKKMKKMKKGQKEVLSNQSEISKGILKLDEGIIKRIDEMFQKREAIKGAMGEFDEDVVGAAEYSEMVLEVVEIQPVDKKKKGDRNAYLPIGSFCRGTLLTGVYAPSNQSNPLPVLISLKEAFYGPNRTRIPLEGTFAIGKAVGDLVSERAHIKIISISTVLPDGVSFESEGNIGYATDNEGQLGLPGEVVYNTAEHLGLSFLTGFMAGASDALAQAETTSTIGWSGNASKNVTGSTGRYAAFSGLAESAATLSDYYVKQLERLVPSIVIDSGVEVVLVIQKGVEIEGLKVAKRGDYRFID